MKDHANDHEWEPMVIRYRSGGSGEALVSRCIRCGLWKRSNPLGVFHYEDRDGDTSSKAPPCGANTGVSP